MKKISILLIIISVLLSDVMCASVSYKYCEFLWGAQYAGYSAPPETAFFMAVPYAVGIIVCLAAAVLLWRKNSRAVR